MTQQKENFAGDGDRIHGKRKKQQRGEKEKNRVPHTCKKTAQAQCCIMAHASRLYGI